MTLQIRNHWKTYSNPDYCGYAGFSCLSSASLCVALITCHTAGAAWLAQQAQRSVGSLLHCSSSAAHTDLTDLPPAPSTRTGGHELVLRRPHRTNVSVSRLFLIQRTHAPRACTGLPFTDTPHTPPHQLGVGRSQPQPPAPWRREAAG